MAREKISNIIAFTFALLFSYAAISKLLDTDKFQVEMGQSPMLTSIVIPLSWAVPLVELVIAICLFQLWLRRMAFYACLSLMVIFTTYIVIIMNYVHHIPCSCGGILQKMGWREHLAFNIAFIVLALLGVVLQDNSSTNKATHHPSAATP